MSSDLERLIKDHEAENRDLMQKIEDEINMIDTIQKDVSERDAHNERLEESIHNLGTEAQQLHEQYKQNQVRGFYGQWISIWAEVSIFAKISTEFLIY